MKVSRKRNFLLFDSLLFLEKKMKKKKQPPLKLMQADFQKESKLFKI